MTKLSFAYEDQIVRVAGRINGGYRIGSAPLRMGAVNDGLIRDISAFQEAVRTALVAADFKAQPGTHVAIAIPERRVLSQVVTIPTVPLAEVTEAVYWEAKKTLPSDPERLAIDYELISSRDARRRSALVIATPREVVEALWQTITSMGFVPALILPRSTGLAEMTYQRPSVPELLIDVEDDDSLTLVVTKNRTARFSTTIALGKDPIQLRRSVAQVIAYYEARDGKHRKIANILLLPNHLAESLRTMLSDGTLPPVTLIHAAGAIRNHEQLLDEYLVNFGLLRTTTKLNLLTPEQQQILRDQVLGRRLITAWRFQLGFAILLVLNASALTGYRAFSVAQTKLPTPFTADERADLTQYAAIASATAALPSLDPKRSHLAKTYRQLVTALNPGIQLVTVEFDRKANRTTVTGQRAGRDSFETFSRALAASFGDVSIPTADWATAAGGSFTAEVQ